MKPDKGGLERIHRGGGGDSDEELEWEDFSDQMPDGGQMMEKIEKTLEEADTAKQQEQQQRRHRDRYGYCCGIDY